MSEDITLANSETDEVLELSGSYVILSNEDGVSLFNRFRGVTFTVLGKKVVIGFGEVEDE